MVSDPIRMCELLVGLGDDVAVLGVTARPVGLEVMVERRTPTPDCPMCSGRVDLKDRDPVRHVDLPSFGQPIVLVWLKRRWRCRNPDCGMSSWTERCVEIAAPRQLMTTRAGRWATCQVGAKGRAVQDVADELSTDWHTVNDTVVAFGEALLEADSDRIGHVEALGLDETLFVREGRWRRQRWATSIVDVGSGQLLDMIQDRTATACCAWFADQNPEWLDGIRFAVLDLSGPYRLVFDTVLPDAHQIADPFHVVKNANQRLDECRRRVQNETLGHRGLKDDPLYRARRLLTKADERLQDQGRSKLLGLLAAGDPHGEVRTAWHAKEVVRQIYDIEDHATAVEFVDRLGHDLQDDSCPPEIQTLGRMLLRWKVQITNWHRRRVTNGPTEAINNLIKRVKRVGFGFRRFRNYRIRALLYAGKPNWQLLNTLTPAEIR